MRVERYFGTISLLLVIFYQIREKKQLKSTGEMASGVRGGQMVYVCPTQVRFTSLSVDRILHPLWVMLAMETETEMIVGVLHDDEYSEEIIDAVNHHTQRDGEDYDQIIDRVNGTPLAVKVKIADLKDNSNMGRIVEPNENDYKRLEKYQHALRELMSETPDN